MVLVSKINENSSHEEEEDDNLETIDFLRSQEQITNPRITWKHLWTFDQTRKALLKSSFSALPTEIMLKIFELLSVRDCRNVALVCRSFKMIVDQECIWKRKCHLPNKSISKSFKQLYIDWIYGKYLRNVELGRLVEEYRYTTISCGLRCLPFEQPVHALEFGQHPSSSSDMTIQLSVDIEKTAHQLIMLLQKASKFKYKWRKSVTLKQMIRRYYRFLQLKVLYPKLFLVPTIDIEIVWQTHLLRPFMYRYDCLRLFHQIIDHSLLLNDDQQISKEQAFQNTFHLYETHFHEKYSSVPLAKNNKKSSLIFIHSNLNQHRCSTSISSYWDETYFQFSLYPIDDYENPFSFAEADIILDGNWIQSCKYSMNRMLLRVSDDVFSFNPSDPIDLTPLAMQRLVKSYERFLYMAAKYCRTGQYDLIHPTYAIDMIWHSHMQQPLNYADDCNRIVGYLLDHYPWPSVGKIQIEQSYHHFDQYWKKEFQINISADHIF